MREIDQLVRDLTKVHKSKSEVRKMLEEFRQSVRLSTLEEVEGVVPKGKAICECGCNFGDGCLCRERKRAFNEIKSKIKEFKTK